MAADPEVLLLHQEQQQLLARTVAQLPPDLRVVVEAAYYQAASYKAIATRLGCPVGTVQARLLRARPVACRPGPGGAGLRPPVTQITASW